MNETKEVLSLRQLRLSYYTCQSDALAESADDEATMRLTAENCRHLCCPVNDIIDTAPTLNYCQLYALAISDLHHGARYWPDAVEEARMETHNAQFQQMKKGELVLTEFFEPMERNKNYQMTLAEVEQSLHSQVCASDMPTLKKLSMALAAHFQSGAII